MAGGAEGGGGLGGALLGLAQFGDGFGQSGEADQQHDWGERPVPGEVGVGGDQPGGVAELVPGRGRGGDEFPGLAGGVFVVVGGVSAQQGAAAARRRVCCRGGVEAALASAAARQDDPDLNAVASAA